VEATVWAMSEAEALLLSRSLRFSPQESALEQGWLLAEMADHSWRAPKLRALFFLFATFFAFYLRQFNPLTPTPSDRPIDSACDNETGASFRPGREPVQTGTIVPVENR
jgi:hypothetical protein